MRVLMVLESSFPTRGGGGAESQLATLSGGLRRRGVRVVVVTPRRRHRRELPAAGRHAGAAVCRIGYPPLPGLGALVLLARLAMLLIAQRRRTDAVHVHIAHHMALVCCALGPLLGLRVVVKVSGWWELDRGLLAARARHSLRGRLARRLLRRAYAFQAISRRVADALQEEGFDPARIHLLPNAVDIDRFRSHAGPGQAARTAVYVGRLVPEKGLDTLIAALARVPDLRLRLVGAGDCLEALRAQVRELGLQARIEFIGHSDGIAAELAQAHVGVLPSLIEGLSNTLLEYMAAGLSVVASRVSGSEDLIEPGKCGWLVTPGDVDGLAAALAEAAALPRERLEAMGSAARSRVARYAGLDIVLDRLLRLYCGDETLPAVRAAHLSGG